MKKLPLISVVMPVYNAGNYLKPAIESVLNQTYQNFELIIIDDASTDNSLELIKQYKEKNPDKIRVIVMSKNLNCGGDMCANEGIKKAKGKYIARMDADDIAHKDRLEKQITFLESHKDVFLVGSNAHVIDKKGKIIGEKLEPSKPYDIYKSYFTFHPLIHPACTFRSKVGDQKFAYKLGYKANNDYLTFFSLICKGYIFANLEDKLLYYRIHGKNDTFVNMKQKFSNTLKIRAKMVLKYGYIPTPKALILNFIQMGMVFLLPEKILFEIYMLTKGITKNKNQKASNIILNIPFPRLISLSR